jgi:hypothetical protein
MLSQDKLNTLNQANTLLNQKHAKLGLKPMLVNGTSPEMFRAALERKLSDRVIASNVSAREEISPRILQVADDYKQVIDEVKAEPVYKIPNKKTYSSKPDYLFFFTGLVLIVGLLIFAYNWWATSLESPMTSNTIVVTSSDRPLAISSGIFTKRSEARAMQTEVERITGDKVRIIKSNGYYTLQIGDSYKSREDAYLLFEELIKYPLRDLAIRSI